MILWIIKWVGLVIFLRMLYKFLLNLNPKIVRLQWKENHLLVFSIWIKKYLNFNFVYCRIIFPTDHKSLFHLLLNVPVSFSWLFYFSVFLLFNFQPVLFLFFWWFHHELFLSVKIYKMYLDKICSTGYISLFTLL